VIISVVVGAFILLWFNNVCCAMISYWKKKRLHIIRIFISIVIFKPISCCCLAPLMNQNIINPLNVLSCLSILGFQKILSTFEFIKVKRRTHLWKWQSQIRILKLWWIERFIILILLVCCLFVSTSLLILDLNHMVLILYQLWWANLLAVSIKDYSWLCHF
jgi:hypothetical protein